jgi:hypothetical protein
MLKDLDMREEVIDKALESKTHQHTSAHTHTYTHAHIHTHTHVTHNTRHTQHLSSKVAPPHEFFFGGRCTCIDTYIHTRTSIYIHTYKYIYTHIYIYIYI